MTKILENLVGIVQQEKLWIQTVQQIHHVQIILALIQEQLTLAQEAQVQCHLQQDLVEARQNQEVEVQQWEGKINTILHINMKKIFIYAICLATINCIFSQDLEDALRYSVGETQGTARFKAMAGAFGALGGDISGVSINPAGSAIFSTSNGSFSASTKSNSLDISYGGSSNKNSSVNLDLHQIGAAFVFENYKKNSPWKKFVLSIFYERLKDYDNEFSIEGTTNNSISSLNFTWYSH